MTDAGGPSSFRSRAIIISGSGYEQDSEYHGALGALFPLISTVFDLLVQGVPFTLSNALQLQRSQPLHWVIDSAPLFLGLFAGLAGRRQDTVIAKVQITSLNQRLQQEQKNLADLAGGHSNYLKICPGCRSFWPRQCFALCQRGVPALVADDQGIQQALDHHIAVLDSDQMSRDIKLESGRAQNMPWSGGLTCLGWVTPATGCCSTTRQPRRSAKPS